MYPDSRMYLCFAFKNKVPVYQFQVLPFCLNTAPQAFTHLGHRVAAYLHRQGISVIPYLDNWLIHHPVLLCHQSQLLGILNMVGLRLKEAKSGIRNPCLAFPGGVHNFHGRLFPGMGCPHGGFSDCGCMDPFRTRASHQCAGAQCGTMGPASLGYSITGPS